MSDTTELLQGTLDLLILKAVSLGPLHGYGVLLRIQQISQNRLLIQQGSLYPALYRLEHQGAHRLRVGRIREQTEGEVLPPHRGGPAPAQGGDGVLADGSRRRSGLPSKPCRRTYELWSHACESWLRVTSRRATLRA